MKFKLTAKQKLSVTEFGTPEPVMCVSPAGDGVFDADSLPFARRDCNTYVRDYCEAKGFKMRTQKDWTKNLKTKALEKQVMVQNGSKPETYIFTLETL